MPFRSVLMHKLAPSLVTFLIACQNFILYGPIDSTKPEDLHSIFWTFHYSKIQLELTLLAMNTFVRDASNAEPLAWQGAST